MRKGEGVQGNHCSRGKGHIGTEGFNGQEVHGVHPVLACAETTAYKAPGPRLQCSEELLTNKLLLWSTMPTRAQADKLFAI